MSLILDALNRSRQEVGDIPGLETRHSAESRRNNHSLLIVGLALLLALGVIVWLLLERSETTVPAVIDVPVVRQPAPVVAPIERVGPTVAANELKLEKPPKPAAKREPVAPAIPRQETEATPVVPHQQESSRSVAADSAVAALYGDEAPQQSLPAETAPIREPAQVEELAKTQAAVVKPTAREEPVDLEKMVLKAQGELENARLSEHPAPFISALSQQSKNAIPTIIYERHDYSGKASQSTVTFSGKALNKGGRTSAGVIVEEILPDSVVLNYKGTQFRLRALNSWVNL